MEKNSDKDEERRSVVLPGQVAADFEKYLKWANETGQVMPGRLGTAAFIAFWSLKPIQQVDMMQRAAVYENEDLIRGSVIPEEAHGDLVRELHGLRAAREARSKDPEGTGDQKLQGSKAS